MKDVKFLGLSLLMKGERDWDKDYDFGGVWMSVEDRAYAVDVTQTYTYEHGEILMDLEDDPEIFGITGPLLTVADFKNPNLKVELYIIIPNEIISMKMTIEVDGEEIILDVTEEN